MNVHNLEDSVNFWAVIGIVGEKSLTGQTLLKASRRGENSVYHFTLTFTVITSAHPVSLGRVTGTILTNLPALKRPLRSIVSNTFSADFQVSNQTHTRGWIKTTHGMVFCTSQRKIGLSTDEAAQDRLRPGFSKEGARSVGALCVR